MLFKTVSDLIKSAYFVYDDLGNNIEDAVPGTTNPSSLTGNLLGDKGVLDDILLGLADGNVGDMVLKTYDNVLADGGIVNNLAEGSGLGVEPLLATVLDDFGQLG